MQRLDKLSNQAQQRYTLISETGDEIIFTLRYMPTQQIWVASFAWNDFVSQGMQLVVSPNMLRCFRNIIPFGLAVTTKDKLDPLYIDDFTTDRIQVYLLSRADVLAIEEQYYE